MSAMAESIKKYGTTTYDCGCPDRQYRRRVCKHMNTLQNAFELVQAAGFEVVKVLE